MKHTDCPSAITACTQFDAHKETEIRVNNIPGLSGKLLGYPGLPELIAVPKSGMSGKFSVKQQYSPVEYPAKGRVIRPGTHGPWKLIHQPLEDDVFRRLFNPETDPKCKTAVPVPHSDVARSLQAALSSWIASGHAP